ncbi:MAG: O-antigen ligase family protein [Pirellulaceae bacterium]
MSSVATNNNTETLSRDSHLRFAMWVWLFVLSSMVAFRHRSVSELMSPGGFDLQVKFQIVAWMALGLLAWQLIVRRVADLRLIAHSPLFWFAMYVAVAISSTLYSQSPGLTLFRAGQLAIVIVLVVSMRENLHRIHLYVFVFLLLNWIFVIAANLGLDFGQSWMRGHENAFMLFGRQNGDAWRLASPLAHSSQIATVGAASAVGLAMRTGRRELPDNLPFILFAVATVLFTVSRTAIAGMLVGFVVVAMVRRRFIPLALLAGVAVPLLLFMTPVGDRLVEYGMRGQSVEEFQSFTGRADIYSQGIERAAQSMPFGEGFSAGRARSIVAKDQGHSIVHAHNLLIESAVSMGMLGLITAILVLFSLGRALLIAIHLKPDHTGVSPGWEPLVMSIPLIAFCVLDRGFASPASPYVFMFVAVLTITTSMLMKHPSPSSGTPPTDQQENHGWHASQS